MNVAIRPEGASDAGGIRAVPGCSTESCPIRLDTALLWCYRRISPPIPREATAVSIEEAECALCRQRAELCDSHIISKFVSDHIKQNSPTGYLVSAREINRRVQDPDKRALLCRDCEHRFGKRETLFAERVFVPFMQGKVLPLQYGSWLYYFITSATWRALYVDLPELEAEPKWNGVPIAILQNAEAVMRDYLLENRQVISPLENHIFFMERASECSPELIGARPNQLIRSSAFSYAFFCPDENWYYVYGNLAGVLICTVIRRGAGDVWQNTRVDPQGGRISTPQHLCGPVGWELLNLIREVSQSRMSPRQQLKVQSALDRDPGCVGRSKVSEFLADDRALREQQGDP